MTTTPAASGHGGAWPRLIAGLAVLFALLALAWMLLLPRLAAWLVRDRTGFEVTMRSFYLDPFTARLKVEGLTITNPPDFPVKGFLDIPDLRIDVRPGSLFRRTWKIDDATVHLSAITLVRDARGGVNARRFEEGRSEPPPREAGDDQTKPSHSFWVGRLALQVDRVVIADYSGSRPVVHTFDIDFKHVYTNVSGIQGLAAPAAAIMARTGDEGREILPQAGSLLRAAGEQLRGAGLKTGAAVKGLFESLEKKLRN